jgi:hypothetical protein
MDKMDHIYSYDMAPIVKINLTAKKYSVSESGQIGLPGPLQSGERAVITLKRKDSNPLNSINNQYAIIGTEATQYEIKLIPGEYSIEGVLTGRGFTINPGCERICSNYSSEDGSCTNYQYLPEEKIDMSNATISGGVKIGEPNRYVTFTSDELNHAKEIEVYVFETPRPNCIDDATAEGTECMIGKCIGIDQMNKIDEYSYKFRNQVEPRLS